MPVVALKLTSSEEVIGELEKETDRSVVLSNPVLVALQQGQNGQMALGFLPFMPYLGKKPISISKDKIIVQEEVDENMKNQYNSVFGGIVTPPKTLITG